MAWYSREYARMGRRERRRVRRPRPLEARHGARSRRGAYGYERPGEYGPEYGGPWARARLPRKAARGYPVRGIHTYDLDYGSVAGGPADYSGRAGYSEDRDWMVMPRGPYTPRLAEIGREARRRRLYGWPASRYSGPGPRGGDWE